MAESAAVADAVDDDNGSISMRDAAQIPRAVGVSIVDVRAERERVVCTMGGRLPSILTRL